MAMPKRKNERRKITVDGSVYWWIPTEWERTEYIRILSKSGQGSTIRVNPLQIMTPRHIAASIKHAIGIGWTADSNDDLWLGFNLNGDDMEIFQIPPNSYAFRNAETGRWDLPRMNII